MAWGPQCESDGFTARNRRVTIDGRTVTFDFKGKSGVHHTIDVANRELSLHRSVLGSRHEELFVLISLRFDGRRDGGDVLHELTATFWALMLD